MSYYLYTSKAYFGKTHLVVGYGEWCVSSCGLKWRRDTTAWKEMKKERVRPVARKTKGCIWPEPKELGVTCAHCLQNGYPPHRWPRRSLPPDKQEDAPVGLPDVPRRKRGSLDVDLWRQRPGSDQFGACGDHQDSE